MSPPARVAWIETVHGDSCTSGKDVATREGGVDRNLCPKCPRSLLVESPPARVAWIETVYSFWCVFIVIPSPPARVAWIETRLPEGRFRRLPPSPPARVAWIETYYSGAHYYQYSVATREGGVDRNHVL